MAITDLYSKRLKRMLGEVPDIYIYDEIPYNLRVQIVHIIQDTIGIRKSNFTDKPGEIYEYVFNTLCHEYGKFSLVKGNNGSHEEQVLIFLLKEQDVEKILDAIELSFICISEISDDYNYHTSVKISPDEAISDLNERFRESGIGYSFDGGQIIRIDSTYIHEEITKPTIALLQNNKFKDANEEYLKAHEHYRYGRNEECLNDCLKAFESTMITICEEKSWTYNQKDAANNLIEVCFENGLVPKYLKSELTTLKSLLKDGIPTIRNKKSAHGQGQTPQKVDDEITRYGLNLTGVNIIFLIEQSGLV